MAFKHLSEDWQFLQKGELKGTTDVTPAKAGVQRSLKDWIPAFAEILSCQIILHLKASLSMKRVEIQTYSGSWVELAPFS